MYTSGGPSGAGEEGKIVTLGVEGSKEISNMASSGGGDGNAIVSSEQMSSLLIGGGGIRSRPRDEALSPVGREGNLFILGVLSSVLVFCSELGSGLGEGMNTVSGC